MLSLKSYDDVCVSRSIACHALVQYRASSVLRQCQRGWQVPSVLRPPLCNYYHSCRNTYAWHNFLDNSFSSKTWILQHFFLDLAPVSFKGQRKICHGIKRFCICTGCVQFYRMARVHKSTVETENMLLLQTTICILYILDVCCVLKTVEWLWFHYFNSLNSH